MDGKKVVRGAKLKKIVKRSYLLGFMSCFALVGILCMAMRVFGFGKLVIGGDYEEYSGIIERYGKYYEIISLIDKKSLSDYSPDEIDDDVIRDVVEELDDKYAAYFTAEEYEEYMKKYKSSFVGIGVVVTETDEGVEIIRAMKDTPAAEAGLKGGDVILTIDGKKPKNIDGATELLQGEAGTETVVVVQRGSKKKSFNITRARIDTDSVYYKKYDKKNKIAYIYISSFKQDTSKEFKLAVKDLKSAGYKKFIIDLRENGGGLTKEVEEIADYLLPEGIIYTEKDKNGKETVEKSGASNAGIELVVLVNGHTASASEILSGAIQDNEAGTIIGTKTYGKGVTQQTFKLSDKSVLKLTVSEYFTPDGHKVNGNGITPDIKIRNDEDIIEVAHDTLLHK